MNDVQVAIIKMAPDMRSGMELYYTLKKEWPQINETTVLQKADGHIMRMCRPSELKPAEKQWLDKPGRKARFWRGLGTILNKPKIIRKGQVFSFPPPPLIEEGVYEIRLYPFSNGLFTLYAGYSPELDVLCYRGANNG